MIRRPPRSTLFPSRRSSDLAVLMTLDASSEMVLITTPPQPRSNDRAMTLPLVPGGPDASRNGFSNRIRSCTTMRSEEHTSELQSPCNIVCRLLLEKKNIHIATLHRRLSIFYNLYIFTIYVPHRYLQS